MSVVEQRIASQIAARHGLSVRGDWDMSIRSILGELGSGASAGSAERLDLETVDRVASKLTISETFFMRHHSQLVFAAEHLAQRLSKGAGVVRVLSAGCSAGEEPYSLVLCLMRLIGLYSPSQVNLVGCDLSLSAIDKARAAEYGNWSFRGVPAWLLKEHFEVVKAGVFRLCPKVCQRVELRHASITDVLNGYGPGTLDVVLFRNVGIYLVEDYLAGLFDRFHRALRNDGVLVVAPSDPRPTGAQFQRVPHDSTGIYRPASLGAAPQLAGERPQRRHGDRSPAARTLPAQALRHPLRESPSPSTILEMADRGELESALELAAKLVARSPTDPESHLLLGQLHMAGVRVDDRRAAIDSLRRAVFIAPEHALARFWYANSLLADGRHHRAKAQLGTLAVLLTNLPDDQLLGNNEMTVSELREAKLFLLEGLS